MVAATMKRTPLHAIHARLGAKLVPFGGYEMPVSYAAGITAEHRAVREAVGVFDVSHMGEFEVTGPDRNAFVQLRMDMIQRPAPSLAKVEAPKAAIEAEGPENPRLASHLAGVKRLEIKGVSHWLMLDDPAALNSALDEVLTWTK